ncbi:MAG: gspL [Hydrocarboniphaga sp.]|uniref:type II secretion system protein GspL n=1 Tax=Hydrocarboniphaga sp. TaxID=2033016 RepID=UPI00260A0801|nr:type II secretion system protein GspL [Hydrocarboniphaga sp.]MDB5968070.1 gspL [Hydrocarboniphaga sp.]
MREIFYIRLPSGVPADAIGEALVGYGIAPGDHTGAVGIQHAPLSQALDRVGGRRIAVIVPGSDVRLASVTVPARQPAKVLAAAPYQLEDQLADDVDTLHFALGTRQADGSWPVAVVSRALMAAWMAPFRERGLNPEGLYPESLALPWDSEAARWSALIEAGQVIVRSGPYSGFCCAPEDLVTYLQLADPEKTRALRLLILANAGLDYSRIEWPLELLPGYGSALEAYSRHLQPALSINLLQGSYSLSQDYERHWKPWRAAAALAGICLLLGAAIYGVQTSQLSREIAAQDQANIGRFQELFPAETRIVDLSAQVDQQIRALKGSGKTGGVFMLMETLSQALGANQGLKLQSLQYREGALYLAMRATDLQVVERLREWFSSQRATALEVQSADASSEGVQVRLKLSPA